MTDPRDPDPARFDAALIGGDLSRGEAAVTAAGGRVVARLRWGDALDLDADDPGERRPVLVVEAEGADEATLAQALPAIAGAAEAFRCAVVAAFDALSIDVVAANLWGPRVELLCQPGLAERAAALSRATSEPEPPAGVREGDEAEDGPAFEAEPPSHGEGDDDDLNAAAIRRAIRARRMRGGFFAPGLFSDPAWDMLLDLYAAEAEDMPVSVSSLCIASAVAPTTALRWIARLTEDGLLDRRPDATDRRRAFMALTEVARIGMRRYLVSLKRAGLSIG
ncbi:winged helix DNA-binding protein [uncultured Sphingomonas sp.]|uniref:winged helix DNA-binding protein n=1 Tax=uncultured Sphingomonas sp. TaxID=158754 RepID=UPI0035CBDA1A